MGNKGILEAILAGHEVWEVGAEPLLKEGSGDQLMDYFIDRHEWEVLQNGDVPPAADAIFSEGNGACGPSSGRDFFPVSGTGSGKNHDRGSGIGFGDKKGAFDTVETGYRNRLREHGEIDPLSAYHFGNFEDRTLFSHADVRAMMHLKPLSY